MQIQKPIPRATAPQSKQTYPPRRNSKTAQLHTVTLNAELNRHYKTGLAALLSNIPLLAVAREHSPSLEIEQHTSNLLQSHIQTASSTLGSTLTALSCVLGDVLHDNVTKSNVETYITPELVADFAALVGELLPVLNEVSNTITLATKKA